MGNWYAIIACAFFASAAHADPCEGPLPKSGSTFEGRVVYVGDGDGLCADIGGLGNPAQWVEVRLADFYAPELSETGGREAKSALTRIAMGRRVVCVAGHRSYDRVVARCVVDGVSVAERLRQAGVREGGRGR